MFPEFAGFLYIEARSASVNLQIIDKRFSLSYTVSVRRVCGRTEAVCLTFRGLFKRDPQMTKFEQLVNEYEKPMFHKAASIFGAGGNKNRKAEDAVQEAFLRVYKNMDKIGTVDSRQTKNLLLTIVENEAKRILAKERSVSVDSFDELEECADPDPAQSFESRFDNQELVTELLNRLSELDRKLLIYRYLHNYSDTDLAEIFQMSSNNVSQRISRTKKKLQSYMLERGLLK